MGMKGFLFDNDGVLIDSAAIHWEAWKALMEEMEDPFLSKKQFIEGFGKRNDLIIRECFPEKSKEEIEQIAERKERNFRKSAKDQIHLLPGMERFLKQLKEAKIPRIIASSTPVANLKMFLASTVLGEYFDQFVSAEEVAHGKPAPDVFLEAAKRLGFPPEECIVIEDATVGIRAGKSAGCFVIGLATTHPKSELFEADLIYDSPHDLDLATIKTYF